MLINKMQTLVVCFLFTFLFVLHSGTSESGEKSGIVVELFTSQGCNSCPPADAFLGELIKQDDIIGLSFHVDYWDYIGWKDTFAAKDYTERQRAYGHVLGQRYVYTPQMVVGGRKHVVGSDRKAVQKTIAYAAMHTPSAAISVTRGGNGENDAVIVEAGDGEPFDGDAWIWLVEYDDKHGVDIRRGENTGRVLSYYNVVRNIQRLGMWRGGKTEVPVNWAGLAANGHDGCVLIVQQEGYGPVLGALAIDLSDQ